MDSIEKQKLLSRITINPKVMVGKPTIRGMRITIEQILDSLAGGVSLDDIFQDYPELEIEDIYAIFLYTARLVREERVFELST